MWCAHRNREHAALSLWEGRSDNSIAVALTKQKHHQPQHFSTIITHIPFHISHPHHTHQLDHLDLRALHKECKTRQTQRLVRASGVLEGHPHRINALNCMHACILCVDARTARC